MGRQVTYSLQPTAYSLQSTASYGFTGKPDGEPVSLRVGVKGGGCSGLSYTFAWETEARTGDEVFEGPDGAKIFVDKKSLLYLNGTVLEYDTSLLGKGFVFNNPNAKSTCGCGSSFGA